MTSWRLSKFPKNPEVKLLPQETEFSDLDLILYLITIYPNSALNNVPDAAAIAFTTIKPIGQWCKPLYVMIPQFKLLTLSWLCVGYMKGDTTKVESCGGLSSKAFR